jgi:hypothetical protein
MKAAAKATQTVGKPTRKADRKARPAIPVAIVNTAPPATAINTAPNVSAREAELLHSMAADYQQQMQAAGFPVSYEFAVEIWTEAARMIAAVDAKVESLRRRLGAVRLMDALESTPTGGLALLLEERCAITEALDLTSGSEALITALAARSLELIEQIINSPARNGAELAAKLSVAIDALNEGEDADSVLPILASCRNDSYSLPVSPLAGCGPASTEAV